MQDPIWKRLFWEEGGNTMASGSGCNCMSCRILPNTNQTADVNKVSERKKRGKTNKRMRNGLNNYTVLITVARKVLTRTSERNILKHPDFFSPQQGISRDTSFQTDPLRTTAGGCSSTSDKSIKMEMIIFGFQGMDDGNNFTLRRSQFVHQETGTTKKHYCKY